MIRKLAWILLFVASVAHAERFPSNPMTIVGLQGRPIPQANVNVTDLAGVPVTVYVDSTSGAVLTLVPPSGVLQFWVADFPGIYIVNVQGQDLTRRYYTTVGIGVGPNVNTISIDRTADLLLTNTTLSGLDQPTLDCGRVDAPCRLMYVAPTPQADQCAYFDFITPSYPITFKSLLLSWHQLLDTTGESSRNMVWGVNWCTYKVGEVFCDPVSAANLFTMTSHPNTVAQARVDVTVLPNQWPTTWEPQDHVSIAVCAQWTDPRNNLITMDVALENVRLEVSR